MINNLPNLVSSSYLNVAWANTTMLCSLSKEEQQFPRVEVTLNRIFFFKLIIFWANDSYTLLLPVYVMQGEGMDLSEGRGKVKLGWINKYKARLSMGMNIYYWIQCHYSFTFWQNVLRLNVYQWKNLAPKNSCLKHWDILY